MTKRSFFKSIMGAVAAVALAPEIAFGTRLKMPEAPQQDWVIAMLWKNDDQLEASLRQPSTQEEQARFLSHAADMFEVSKPDCAFTNLPPKPYAELQRLRKEAGLTS